MVCQGPDSRDQDSQDQDSQGQGQSNSQDLLAQTVSLLASLMGRMYVLWVLLADSRFQEVAYQVAFAQVGCLQVVLDPKDLLPRVELETCLVTTPSVVAHLSEEVVTRVENSLLDEIGLSEKIIQRKTLLSKISDWSQKHKRKGCQG